jgi:hypothetical protein
VFLKQHPITEEDYWKAIYSLGGYIQSTEHGLLRGHITTGVEEVQQSIKDARKLSKQLLEEVCQKFNIVVLNNSPMTSTDDLPKLPEGKMYYRDWYYKWKKLLNES